MFAAREKVYHGRGLKPAINNAGFSLAKAGAPYG
jgi:hypothetical protein